MTIHTFLNHILTGNIYNQVVSLSGKLFEYNNKSSKERYQIIEFNSVWGDAYSNIPFYKEWKEKNGLPDRISSVKELMSWPIITKQELMASPGKLYRTFAPKTHIITSGSTGIPLRLPSSNGSATQGNMWIGRAANGIMPGSRTFLIWGHHHLHGKGLKRVYNTLTREIKDWLLNYKRVSAYDTSIPAMEKAYAKYIAFNPEFVIGYSSSILAFVRCNKGKRIPQSPKSVLCTAGPLSGKEKNEIRKFFNAPICMEYGSLECGVMAYTVEDSSYYNVFWTSHIVQGITDETGNVRNAVTSLSKKYFPLIRYDIGDYLEIDQDEDMSNIMKIQSIIGRPTDIVTLPCGVSFFAMLIEACVEHIEGMLAHQLTVQNDMVEVSVVGNRIFSDAEIDSIRQKILVIIPALSDNHLKLKQVNELQKTKGGKTPLVIRE